MRFTRPVVRSAPKPAPKKAAKPAVAHKAPKKDDKPTVKAAGKKDDKKDSNKKDDKKDDKKDAKKDDKKDAKKDDGKDEPKPKKGDAAEPEIVATDTPPADEGDASAAEFPTAETLDSLRNELQPILKDAALVDAYVEFFRLLVQERGFPEADARATVLAMAAIPIPVAELDALIAAIPCKDCVLDRPVFIAFLLEKLKAKTAGTALVEAIKAKTAGVQCNAVAPGAGAPPAN